MRYRSFGHNGMAISAVSLALTDVGHGAKRVDWQALVCEALELGINAFEIVGQDPAILDGLSSALENIERRLVFVAKRLGPTPTGDVDYSGLGMTRMVESCLARTGLGHFDAVLLNDPPADVVTQDALDALKTLRDRGSARHLGITGEGPSIDAFISSRRFDVLSMPYNLLSGWISRNRIREAVDHHMTIMGYGFAPPAVAEPKPKLMIAKRLFWGGKKSVEELRADAYAFLHDTHGWTAEEICLSYALTQPALATIQLGPEHAGRLAELTAIPERDMPPGLAPRIEMARFGEGQVQQRA